MAASVKRPSGTSRSRISAPRPSTSSAQCPRSCRRIPNSDSMHSPLSAPGRSPRRTATARIQRRLSALFATQPCRVARVLTGTVVLSSEGQSTTFTSAARSVVFTTSSTQPIPRRPKLPLPRNPRGTRASASLAAKGTEKSETLARCWAAVAVVATRLGAATLEFWLAVAEIVASTPTISPKVKTTNGDERTRTTTCILF